MSAHMVAAAVAATVAALLLLVSLVRSVIHDGGCQTGVGSPLAGAPCVDGSARP